MTVDRDEALVLANWLDGLSFDPRFQQIAALIRDLTVDKGPAPPRVRGGGRHAYWRAGRKVGRTIYLQRGEQPSDDDPLIGVMDTQALAEIAVLAVNQWSTDLADRLREEGS